MRTIIVLKDPFFYSTEIGPGGPSGIVAKHSN
jgi:hypothetical protein